MPRFYSIDVVQFRVNVSDQELEDLQARIQSDLQRLVGPLPESGFQYGFNSKFLAEVAEYWSQTYDWRTAERTINSLPQFRTNIDGLNIHFLHVKRPELRGKTRQSSSINNVDDSLNTIIKPDHLAII